MKQEALHQSISTAPGAPPDDTFHLALSTASPKRLRHHLRLVQEAVEVSLLAMDRAAKVEAAVPAVRLFFQALEIALRHDKPLH